MTVVIIALLFSASGAVLLASRAGRRINRSLLRVAQFGFIGTGGAAGGLLWDAVSSHNGRTWQIALLVAVAVAFVAVALLSRNGQGRAKRGPLPKDLR